MIDCPWFFSIILYNFNFFQYNQKDKENNFVTQSLVFYGFNTVYTFLLKIIFF